MRHDVMEQSAAAGLQSGVDYWATMMSARANGVIQRASARATILDLPTDLEMLDIYERARSVLTLGEEAPARRMLKKNPNIVRAVRAHEGGPALGLFAYLPLNEFGAMLMTTGQFDGTAPDPAWICRQGEAPAALYEWLFYGPNLYLRTLPAIGALYASLSPSGCTLFSRGSTNLSAKLLLKLGYIEARSLYPEARADFVALIPKHCGTQLQTVSDRAIEIRQVRTFEELAQIISIRSATYIAEQFPTYAEEFDGNDFCGTHLAGYVGGDPAGAIRIRYFGDFAKLERLAVKLEFRSTGLALKLVKAAMAHVRQKGFTRVYGHASDELVPFWQQVGGEIVPGSKPFTFANIKYNEMSAELERDPLAIQFGVPPMMTIRPEGLWDEPGALDWSNVVCDPTREKLLAKYMSVGKR